jgi:putative membrane protein
MRCSLKFGVIVTALFSCATPLFAESHLPNTSAAWTWPPYIAVPLFATALLYILGIARRPRMVSPVQYLRAACFAAGWLSLLIALDSPIHEISEQLFWVHMTQHEILMLVSAPLLVVSEPAATLLWALPESWRSPIARLGKLSLLRRTWLLISAPVAAWLLHAIALWAWHAPRLFVAALESNAIHAAQHISFLGTALVFWWTLFHGHGGRLGYGAAILYVFTTAIHTSVLGAWLTFSPQAWYAPYVSTAPLWNLTAIQDQQLGGLIMWIPAGTLLTIVALVLLAKWIRHSELRWEYTKTAALIRASQGAAQ